MSLIQDKNKRIKVDPTQSPDQCHMKGQTTFSIYNDTLSSITLKTFDPLKQGSIQLSKMMHIANVKDHKVVLSLPK